MMQQDRLMSKVLKREMKVKRRREGQVAAERAAAEASRLLRERREALVVPAVGCKQIQPEMVRSHLFFGPFAFRI